MEHPSFEWRRFFDTNISDLGVACRVHAASHPEFAKDYREENGRHYYWGWRLAFRHDVFKEGM